MASEAPLAGRPASIGAAPIAQTCLGKVQGFMDRDVQTFLGMPYAGAPVGAHRFRAPPPATPWNGVRDATAYGASAIQTQRWSTERGPPIWTDAPGLSTSEDCLFINVWTAAAEPARKRPVMVWVHTGGFGSGSGSAPL